MLCTFLVNRRDTLCDYAKRGFDFRAHAYIYVWTFVCPSGSLSHFLWDILWRHHPINKVQFLSFIWLPTNNYTYSTLRFQIYWPTIIVENSHAFKDKQSKRPLSSLFYTRFRKKNTNLGSLIYQKHTFVKVLYIFYNKYMHCNLEKYDV